MPCRRIPRIQGGQEHTLTGTAELTSTTHRQVWARPPIDVDFQVLMFTASGLIVRFLKVFEKSNYHSIKWVRYLTKASGTYQIRVSRCRFLRNITLIEASLLDWRSFSGFRYVDVPSCTVVGNLVLPLAMSGAKRTEMTQFVLHIL